MSNATRHCQQLENGQILVFPRTPFDFPAEDQEFLRGIRQAAGRHHKNIAYRPLEHRVTGHAGTAAADTQRLRDVLGDYSRRATAFLAGLLSPYAASWRLDYASFRPQQEQGRAVRQRARNDLLHVDAFPTRPTNGDLILRLFTNINTSEPRVWVTGEPFPQVVQQLADGPGFPTIRSLDQSAAGRLGRSLARLARSAGLPLAARSPYDRFMLELHHHMKEDAAYQADCPKKRWEFPPGATWVVFTDVTPHAALSGQFALEQTYIVARESLVQPRRAPAAVLEELAGGPVTFPVARRRAA